jgi:hypothetical protein
MPQSLVEIAKDLTAVLIETGNVLPEDMQNTLQKTHATLSALKAQEGPAGAFKQKPTVMNNSFCNSYLPRRNRPPG